MKKVLLAGLMSLLIIGLAKSSYAVPGSITLNSATNSGADYSYGINHFFEAGTYDFSVVSGGWNAWFGSTGVTGCNQSGANCATGWMWSMDIYQPSTSTYFRLGSKIDRYDTQSKALSAHASDHLVLNQPTDGDLWFFIKDGNPGDGKKYVWDNSGSVTFAVAPEPVSSILFVIGGATLGFRHFRNKRKSV
jgi:hypothetical protein